MLAKEIKQMKMNASYFAISYVVWSASV